MEIIEGVLEVSPFTTATIAMVVLFVGKWLNHRVRFLRDFNIPEPARPAEGQPTRLSASLAIASQ